MGIYGGFGFNSRRGKRYMTPNQDKCSEAHIIPQADQVEAMKREAGDSIIITDETIDSIARINVGVELQQIVTFFLLIGQEERATKVNSLWARLRYSTINIGYIIYYPRGKNHRGNRYEKYRHFILAESHEDKELLLTILKWWKKEGFTSRDTSYLDRINSYCQRHVLPLHSWDEVHSIRLEHNINLHDDSIKRKEQ